VDFSQRLTDRQMYNRLDKMRNVKYQEVCAGRFAKLGEAMKYDEKAQRFIDNVIDGRFEEVVTYLGEIVSPKVAISASGADGPLAPALPESRTIILIDATGSMKQSMNCVRNSLQYLFEYMQAVCGENSVFKVQIVVYRNYADGPDAVVQASVPSTDPGELIAFIDRCGSCYGGGVGGREAIEAGLQYINTHMQCFEPTQVIIIGDASYNSNINVNNGRQTYEQKTRNQRVWEKFPITEFRSEQRTLLSHVIETRPADNNRIKMHTFFVEKEHVKLFERNMIEGYKREFADVATAGRGRFFTINPRDDEASRERYLREAGIIILRDVAANETDARVFEERFEVIIRSRRPAFIAESG
jgi:hypothetical protein